MHTCSTTVRLKWRVEYVPWHGDILQCQDWWHGVQVADQDRHALFPTSLPGFSHPNLGGNSISGVGIAHLSKLPQSGISSLCIREYFKTQPTTMSIYGACPVWSASSLHLKLWVWVLMGAGRKLQTVALFDSLIDTCWMGLFGEVIGW